MSRLLPALLFLLVAAPGCSLFGGSCDSEADSLECYCEENPENCRDTPEARASEAPEEPAR